MIGPFLTVRLPNGERYALPVDPTTRIQWEPATGEVFIDGKFAGRRDTKIDLSWQSLQPIVTLVLVEATDDLVNSLLPYPEDPPEPLSIQRLRSR